MITGEDLIEATGSGEDKNRHPAHTPEQQAVVELLRTAFMVRRRLQEEMQRHGVTGQQYNVLRILRGSAEPLPIMKIAARMIEPEPGITRMIRRLEAKGLLKRMTAPTDARKSLCAVTDKGLRILDQLDEPVARTNREITGSLQLDEISTLVELLNRVYKQVRPD